MTELAKKNACCHRSRSLLHRLLGRRFLSVEHPQHAEDGPGGLPHFLCDCQSDGISCRADQGRGILGVVDGFSPKGIEDDGDIQWRKSFLRQIGYKQ